jgi:hypothetical protein
MAARAARKTQMKPYSKKPGGTKKNRTKRTQSQRRQNTTKPFFLALAARMRTAGTKRPNTAPPVKPVARIKGNSVPGGKGALYCSVLGDMADTAVDEMEQAIIKDDEAALQKAIEDFRAAWDDGHSNGCYFTYV